MLVADPALALGAMTQKARDKPPKVNDYYIGGMNLGWEVSGLSDVAMAVKGLSVVVGERR